MEVCFGVLYLWNFSINFFVLFYLGYSFILTEDWNSAFSLAAVASVSVVI